LRNFIVLLFFVFLFLFCSSKVKFIQTDSSYQIKSKSDNANIIFRKSKIQRPHRVIGIIEATLGKNARRPQLDAIILKKAREIGADAVMLVEYDIDRDVYLERHHAVVGRGPWRRHVVGRHPRVDVKKTATALAVIFR
jgi:hypothetical protein